MSSYLIEGYEGFNENYETFVDIENFEDYQISDWGRVFSKRRNKYLERIKNTDGYLRITFYKKGKRKSHYVHRLVLNNFVLNTENKTCVDHKNNIKTDNRICNLRYVSPQENSYNKAIYKNNKAGCKGVYFNKHANKFQVQISFKGEKLYLGLFNNLEDAKLARCKKAIELFGEFLHVSEKLIF